jgi:hypothetical protein
MRLLTLRVAVALLTLTLGVSVAGAWRSLFGPETAPEDTTSVGDKVSERELLAIMRQFGPAQTRHDASFFERLEADEYTVHCRDGSTLTKSQVIADLMTWDETITYRHDDLRVQVFGDTAVVTGWITAVRPTDEYLNGTRWQSIYLFAKRHGRWRLLSTTQVNN